MIKGLIFDKDGTLFDFNATWGAWAHTMLHAELGHDAGQMNRLADAMGFNLNTSEFQPGSPVIAGTGDEVVDIMHPFIPGVTRAELAKRMDVASAQAPQVEAVPLLPWIRQLKTAGLVLGVATNDAEAPARAHLGKVGITDHFDFIAGFDSGHGGKPAPGQLLAFCDTTGLSPHDCAMVGDSLHDLHAGRAAGMTTIGVLTGPARREDLAPFADAVLANIGAIPEWLDHGS